MRDENKTKVQLIGELGRLRQRLAELEAKSGPVEGRLQKGRDFAESLIETARVIVLVLDAEARIVRFNPYMEEISGYRLAEIQGRDWFTTFLPERDHARIREVFRRALSGIPTQGNVNPILTKDGREREIEWYDMTLRDAAGRIIGLLSIGQDITERLRAEEALNAYRDHLEQLVQERTAALLQVNEQLQQEIADRQQMEEALRESEEKYRTLVEQSLVGLTVVQDFRIVFANTAFAEISGYSVEELTSLSPEDVQAIIHSEDRALVWGRFRDRLTGKPTPPRYEYRGIRKDGAVRWLEMSASRIEYRGQPAVQGTFVDITARKRAEEERNELIAELREALSRVKTLRGLLPICASCKKIRDDEGYWHQVEAYITEHSEVGFTHGICPTCAEELYPELLDDDEGNKEASF